MDIARDLLETLTSSDFLDRMSLILSDISYGEDEDVDDDDVLYGFEKYPKRETTVLTDGKVVLAWSQDGDPAEILAILTDPDLPGDEEDDEDEENEEDDLPEVGDHIMLCAPAADSAHELVMTRKKISAMAEVLNALLDPASRGYLFETDPASFTGKF